ncbi:hypothetical protein ACI3KS_15345 [Microbacterium sp. ZW T5_45]|uniref:hypothetical protein n=1 Tax=Microbacterium sp. ZW T5_45 TaxID=3378080 RepID=UPI00385432A6
MSGIEIDHGGAISVDPEALRDVATRMTALATDFAEARSSIETAYRRIVDAPGLAEHVDTSALWSSGVHTEALREDIESAVVGVRLMADVFEYVDLKAEADALALTDAVAADELRARMDEIAQGDPRVPDMATMLVQSWVDDRFAGLDNQYTAGGLLSPLFFGAAAMGAHAGLGKIWPGMTLSGAADPVSVTPVKTSTPATAPGSASEALGRMPSGSGAQIAVEKYTMPDGSTKFVTYLVGTQNFLPWQSGGSEPWDMKSNVELYGGTTSASYQATLDALAAAGARPGDEVDVVAHSQSGMIAAHLAMESEYDVQVQVTAGSPVEPTLEDDQTLIQFRHTDDLVSGLAGGGAPGGTGSPDSVTVSREGDPVSGIQDVWLQTHHLDTYIETAELAEESGDPRMESLDDFWDGLDDAVEIERTEFHAEREK